MATHTYQIADLLQAVSGSPGGTLAGLTFAFLLIFTRIGGAMMFLPGIGETYVTPRARLMLALVITLLLLPVLGPRLPHEPTQPAELALLLGAEATIGLFLGLTVRLMVSALDFAGQIISLQLGLGSAMAFNPAMATQGTVIGTMMGMTGLLLMFASNLHHLLLTGIVQSYTVMPVLAGGDIASGFDMQGLEQNLVATVGRSFMVALMISAPFIILGTLFQIAMGLLSRLQPSVQIFFVSMPAQIYIGMAIFATLLGAMLSLWLDQLADTYAMIGLATGNN